MFFVNCIVTFALLMLKINIVNIFFILQNLILASSMRKNFSSGAINNLISVDVERIAEFALYVTSLISAPFRIILIIAVMWQYLGPSCLSGVAVIATLIPISFYMTRISEKFSVKSFPLIYFLFMFYKKGYTYFIYFLLLEIFLIKRKSE